MESTQTSAFTMLYQYFPKKMYFQISGISVLEIDSEILSKDFFFFFFFFIFSFSTFLKHASDYE